MSRRTTLAFTATAALTAIAFAPLAPSMPFTDEQRNAHESKLLLGEFSTEVPDEVTGATPCVDGVAENPDVENARWACRGVDLVTFFPTSQTSDQAGGDVQANLGRGGKIEISDSWGWTAESGTRYIIAGKTNGAAFFRVLEDEEGNGTGLLYLGDLPNPSPSRSVWHDIKIHDDTAYVVAESLASGMLVFDLTQLEAATGEQDWSDDAQILSTGIESHNIVINEDAGTAYLVGGTAGLDPTAAECSSGLVIADLTPELAPAVVGCWDERGYVHDAHCLRYDGPDADHVGKDLCFTANIGDDTMSIVDVTDPAAPVEIANAGYTRGSYAHQGWLSEDGAYFFFGDEADADGSRGTRTMIFDVRDLDGVGDAFEWINPSTFSIDHNLYTHDGLLYQANYSSGLRVLDTRGMYDGDELTADDLVEVAYFDVYPEHDDGGFVGSWSVYPFFDDGLVAISAYDGLYLVQLHEDVLELRFDPTELG